MLLRDTKTFLCLTALCLPKTRWSAEFLHALGHVLEVSNSSIAGAASLFYSPLEHSSGMLERAETMAAALRDGISKERAITGFVTILLIILRGQELALLEQKNKKQKVFPRKKDRIQLDKLHVLRFDARTSVVLRRLALLLRIKISALAALEELAIREMQQETKLVQDSPTISSSNRKNHWIRAAKIGAVATAAGGLMAVTGGLAAPALATGLASLGLAGAATFATTATVAALLGAGGASLGAYRMTNRTKGVTHFEFQRINSQHQTCYTEESKDELKGMTVYICISGYLRQAGPVKVDRDSQNGISSILYTTDAANSSDFYTPWGAEPEVSTTLQILDRFYAQVNPAKRKLVPHIVKQYAGQEEELMNELQQIYGIHPLRMAPIDAQPSYYVEDSSDDATTYNILLLQGLELLQTILADPSKTPQDMSCTTRAMELMMDSTKSWTEACQHYAVDQPPEDTAISSPIQSEDEMQKVMNGVSEQFEEKHHEEKEAPLLSQASRDALEEEMSAIHLDVSHSEEVEVELAESSDTTEQDEQESGGVIENNTKNAVSETDASGNKSSGDAAVSVSSSSDVDDEPKNEASDDESTGDASDSVSSTSAVKDTSMKEVSGDQSAGGAADNSDSSSSTVADKEARKKASDDKSTDDCATIDLGSNTLKELESDDKSANGATESVDSSNTKTEDKSTDGSQKSDDDSLRNEYYWWHKSIANYGDQYTLIWEPDLLLAIGKCFQQLVKEGLSKGVQQSLRFTVLSSIAAAIAFPAAIASFVNTLDESWTCAIESADEAGKLVADALMSEAHGDRPVVLIGFSVGGRVVASCLTELADIANGRQSSSSGTEACENELMENMEDFAFLTNKIETNSELSEEEKKRRLRAATIVRDAVIVGAPCDTSSVKWAKRRSVVLGRLINVYNPSDWVLALLYRFRRWSVLALAGLKAVSLPQKDDNSLLSQVENFNVSDLVDGHGDYCTKMGAILNRVGIGDVEECEEFHPNYFLTSRESST